MANACTLPRVILLLMLGIAPGQALAQTPGLFDADGYRAASYRAPVDRDPAPATRIEATALAAFQPGRDALLVDVLPAEGARRDGASGVWILATAHQSLPGAQWYPDTGRSPPLPAAWQALLTRARQFQSAHPGAPIVVFCRADCWMSWNAARRLARAGLSPVRWFAEGIDGWHDHGWPLSESRPVPIPDSPTTTTTTTTSPTRG